MGTWTEAKDDNGNEYFYNSETGVSVWERPEELGGMIHPKFGAFFYMTSGADTAYTCVFVTAEGG